MSESCDGCYADATHFLCDECLGEDERDKLRAEVESFRSAVRKKERLELEALQELDEARAEVKRLTKALDVCSSVHAHNVKLHKERERLREALRGLVSALSARLTRGEDEEPGDFDRAWQAACAALAGAPSETRGEPK